MNKFVITEEEKSRILNLYEQGQELVPSQFAQDMGIMLGVTTQSLLPFDMDLHSDNPEGFVKSLMSMNSGNSVPDILKNLADDLVGSIKSEDVGQIQDMVNKLTTYKGQMTPKQKMFVSSNIEILNNYIKEKSANTETITNTPPQEGEKINTTNDRSYDYKLSGGKYYYSPKGQNKWVEAKGKGLESIKSKVKF
jgi:hypothetical protein